MSDSDISGIGADPAAVDADQRDPARRLRGRLAAPVTVWTTGTGSAERVGLTVSSIWVVEGEPPRLGGLVGPLSDFADAVAANGRFVVHVIGSGQLRLADIFAGRYPTPDPFAGLDACESEWGPVLATGGDRAYCRLARCTELGWSLLVDATVERFETVPLPELPLVHYRGRYATLGSRR